MFPIIVNSLPGKTGTHLVTRLLDLCGLTRNHAINISYPQMLEAIGVSPFEDIEPDSPQAAKMLLWLSPIADLKHPHYIGVHHIWNPISQSYLASIGARMILVVRRPEAVVLSALDHRLAYGKKRDAILRRDMRERVEAFIGDDNELTKRGVLWFFRNSHRWSVYPHLCVVNFDDLVGPAGGGDARRQLKAISKVLAFLQLDATAAVGKVPDELFGHSPTFNVGSVNRWREHAAIFETFSEIDEMNRIVAQLDGAQG